MASESTGSHVNGTVAYMTRCADAVLLAIAGKDGVLRIIRASTADADVVRELRHDDRARLHGALSSIHRETHKSAFNQL